MIDAYCISYGRSWVLSEQIIINLWGSGGGGGGGAREWKSTGFLKLLKGLQGAQSSPEFACTLIYCVVSLFHKKCSTSLPRRCSFGLSRNLPSVWPWEADATPAVTQVCGFPCTDRGWNLAPKFHPFHIFKMCRKQGIKHHTIIP